MTTATQSAPRAHSSSTGVQHGGSNGRAANGVLPHDPLSSSAEYVSNQHLCAAQQAYEKLVDTIAKNAVESHDAAPVLQKIFEDFSKNPSLVSAAILRKLNARSPEHGARAAAIALRGENKVRAEAWTLLKVIKDPAVAANEAVAAEIGISLAAAEAPFAGEFWKHVESDADAYHSALFAYAAATPHEHISTSCCARLSHRARLLAAHNMTLDATARDILSLSALLAVAVHRVKVFPSGNASPLLELQSAAAALSAGHILHADKIAGAAAQQVAHNLFEVYLVGAEKPPQDFASTVEATGSYFRLMERGFAPTRDQGDRMMHLQLHQHKRFDMPTTLTLQLLAAREAASRTRG